MPAPIYFTRDMLRELPDDGNRYELVRGELLVTPAPRPWHEVVAHRLHRLLEDFVQASGLPLHVFGSRSEISWGDSDTEVQPDIFVVPIDQARTLSWERLTDLRLVVEVLSPSSQRHDRFTKRHEYQRRRVPLYWIVDLDERVVEAWTPDDHFPLFERERLVWHPAGAAEPFIHKFAELFRPI
ncbi:MAG: Uma2 family endonuclease [Gemmatimonadales bacterium]